MGQGRARRESEARLAGIEALYFHRRSTPSASAPSAPTHQRVSSTTRTSRSPAEPGLRSLPPSFVSFSFNRSANSVMLINAVEREDYLTLRLRHNGPYDIPFQQHRHSSDGRSRLSRLVKSPPLPAAPSRRYSDRSSLYCLAPAGWWTVATSVNPKIR